jgi:hypothetical protein
MDYNSILKGIIDRKEKDRAAARTASLLSPSLSPSLSPLPSSSSLSSSSTSSLSPIIIINTQPLADLPSHSRIHLQSFIHIPTTTASSTTESVKATAITMTARASAVTASAATSTSSVLGVVGLGLLALGLLALVIILFLIKKNKSIKKKSSIATPSLSDIKSVEESEQWINPAHQLASAPALSQAVTEENLQPMMRGTRVSRFVTQFDPQARYSFN